MGSKRHIYDYEIDIKSDSAPARVIRMIGGGRRVLELGCGPGAITRHLARNSCVVTALELDSAAIEQAKRYCEVVHRADLNRDDWHKVLGDDPQFDIVLAADVLEHLYDPSATLKTMASLAGSGGAVILSLPHVGHSAVHACLYSGNFEYRDWGLLDRTHIRFFCLKNMQALVEKCGLKIVDAEFVSIRPEKTEFAVAWRRLPRQLRVELEKSVHGDIYQVVLKAIRADQPGTSVSLEQRAVATAGKRKQAILPRLAAALKIQR